jgi:hypothetical protein
MRVTLHCCGTPRRFGLCWRVQKSLDEEGIPYEVAAGPWRPKKRTIVLEGTGQSLYTAIRFEDGSWYREELTYSGARELGRAGREARPPRQRQPPHRARAVASGDN